MDRAEAAGFVRLASDPRDGCVVRVQLTPQGAGRLIELTPAHLEQPHRLAEVLDELVAGRDGSSSD
ncbi:MAG TPA: hypothetical protein VMV92_11635 [Streptosporangiaceae bacterium]|nr:hypothetical protein [Streptosporangiaceae bacterium]